MRRGGRAAPDPRILLMSSAEGELLPPRTACSIPQSPSYCQCSSSCRDGALLQD